MLGWVHKHFIKQANLGKKGRVEEISCADLILLFERRGLKKTRKSMVKYARSRLSRLQRFHSRNFFLYVGIIYHLSHLSTLTSSFLCNTKLIQVTFYLFVTTCRQLPGRKKMKAVFQWMLNRELPLGHCAVSDQLRKIGNICYYYYSSYTLCF